MMKNLWLAVGFIISITTIGYAQDNTITGAVTDLTNDEGLPGVNIVAKGTSIGTVTDVNGNYRLTVSSGVETLVFSSVGFMQEEQIINGQTVINVAMNPDIQSLQEVVVVGYGTQEKEDVTGAISSVSSQAIEKIPVPSFNEAIQGQVAGVNVQSSSGQPGAAVSIKIRGQNSVNLSSQPLYILDGMIIQSGDGGLAANASQQANLNIMSTINPNDIASVTVLKDAASAAIYGARSGNGVVVITTKKGTPGQARINLNAFYGVQRLRNKIDMADAQLYKDIEIAAGSKFPVLTDPSNTVNTDWQDELFTSGTESYLSSQDLSVSGGTENMNYYVSLNHYDEQGIVRNTGMERFGIRANVSVTDGRFRLGNNLYVSNTAVDRMGNFDASPIDLALRMPSTIPVLDSDNVGGFGGPDGDDGDQVLNPIGVQTLNSNTNERTRLVGNAFAEYDFIEGLTYRLNLGYDLAQGNSRFYSPFWESGDVPSVLRLDEYRADDRSWLVDNTLSYDKTIGVHHLGLLAGASQQKMVFRNLEASTVPASQSTPVTGAQASILGVNGGESVQAIASFFGRVNYALNDRYIVQGVLRYDGISKFNDGYRWGLFPSVSAAWRVSEEAFMNGVTFVSDLKLRASYGLAGNANVGNYAAQSTLNSQARYVIGDQVVVGSTIDRVRPSQDLTWETVKELNIGVDMGLLENRLLLAIDYYRKETTDLLLNGAVPATTGFAQFVSNVGSMRNSGVDISALFRTTVGDWDLSFNANAGFIYNEIITLSDGNDILTSNWGGINSSNRIIQREGEAAGSFYGLIFDGIYQEDVLDDEGEVAIAAGSPRFQDISGPNDTPDGVIDGDDATILGGPLPDVIYGLTANAAYRNFDLSLVLFGMSGNEIFSTTKFSQLGLYRSYNMGHAAADFWTPTNPSNTMQSANVQDTNVSSRWVEDGSFLRLRNVQLGYNFPETAFGGIFSSFRLYVSGKNLLVLSGYDDWGYDPEVGAGGIDGIGYPQARAVLVGLNLGF